MPELSSDDMYVKATMALIMALNKAETQNRLDSLDQVVDSLWYPLTTGLRSFHYTYNLSSVVG